MHGVEASFLVSGCIGCTVCMCDYRWDVESIYTFTTMWGYYLQLQLQAHHHPSRGVPLQAAVQSTRTNHLSSGIHQRMQQTTETLKISVVFVEHENEQFGLQRF